MEPEEEVKKVEGELPRFKINSIVFKGADLISRTDKYFLKKPFLGKEMDLNDINELVRNITNLYIKYGYTTTRAYIPKQNLKKGDLLIVVVEGRIEDIVYEDEKQPDLQLITAFPFLKDKKFNIRAIEQGLDQLNRLQSNNASLKLVPSEKMGWSKVVIANYKSSEYSANLNYDNNTNYPIHFYPHSLSFSKDNLLNINDNWYLSLSQDNGETSQYSNSGSLMCSIPFGSFTMNASYSRFDYMTAVSAFNQYSHSTGLSISESYGFSKVIYRNQIGKTTLDSNFSVSKSKNYSNDYLNSESKYGVLDVGINQTLRLMNAFWSFALRYHRGIDGLPEWDFTRDDDTSEHSPQSKFHKTSADISFYYPLQVLFMPLTFRSTVHGQFSDVTLHNTQKTSIGGFYSVRGFKDSYISGDLGYYIRNELSTPLASFMPWKFLKEHTFGIEYFGGIDYGYVYTKGGPEMNFGRGEGRLKGCATGFKYYGQDMTYSITWTYPLEFPDFIENEGLSFYWMVGMRVF